jgi:N-acyl-D-amino-acid deacylase
MGELNPMRRLVVQAMEQGAFGLSSGLTLYPSLVAATDELVALCEEVAKWGGLYDTHTRYHAGRHVDAVEEATEIGRRAGTAVHVAHIAITESRYRGQSALFLETIFASAETKGVDLSFDAYPYTASGFPPSELMPSWVQDGGTETMLARLADPVIRSRVLAEAGKTWDRGICPRWDAVSVAWGGPHGDRAWLGTTVADLARDASVSPEEMLLDILIQTRDIGMIINRNRAETDVERFICHPRGAIGSDGIAIAADTRLGEYPVHPRFYGTFPRVLARYVRRRKGMSWEEAIRKMTSLPADRLGLKDRGRLCEGAIADLVVLDPESVQDVATFTDPHRHPVGIPHVMVCGRWVVRDGVQTTARPGQILRRNS